MQTTILYLCGLISLKNIYTCYTFPGYMPLYICPNLASVNSVKRLNERTQLRHVFQQMKRISLQDNTERYGSRSLPVVDGIQCFRVKEEQTKNACIYDFLL